MTNYELRDRTNDIDQRATGCRTNNERGNREGSRSKFLTNFVKRGKEKYKKKDPLVVELNIIN